MRKNTQSQTHKTHIVSHEEPDSFYIDLSLTGFKFSITNSYCLFQVSNNKWTVKNADYFSNCFLFTKNNHSVRKSDYTESFIQESDNTGHAESFWFLKRTSS